MTTMKALAFDRYGGPEVMTLRDLPRPEPGPGEVLVQVRATSLNPLDDRIRSGALWFLTGRRFPKVVGGDVSGDIVAAGAGATRFPVGTRVYGTIDLFAGRTGACAEYAVARETEVAAIPGRLSYAEAASLPVAALTALVALRDVCRLEAGARLLVVGASGGVGTHALQIARGRGAHVTGTASAHNLDHIRTHGADEVIDRGATDPRTLGGPFDVILDLTDVGSFWAYRHALAARGTYVTTVPTPAAMLTAKLTAVVGRRRAHAFNLSGRIRPSDLEELGGLVESGVVRPAIEETVSLAEVPRLHAARQARRGKSVITVAP